MFRFDNTITLKYIAGLKLGQAGEVSACYTLTGKLVKPDANTPYYKAGDFHSEDWGEVQVKTQKATIAEGWNMKAHIERDAADMYAYVTKDLEHIILMSPAEWLAFCERFGYKCYSSDGTRQKIRLRAESAEMLLYLDYKIEGQNYGRPYYWGRGY